MMMPRLLKLLGHDAFAEFSVLCALATMPMPEYIIEEALLSFLERLKEE